MAAIFPEKFKRNLSRTVAAGALGVLSIVGWQLKSEIGTVTNCIANIKTCVDPHFSADKDQPKAPAYSNFKKDSEQLTATVGIQSFGQAKIVVQGTGHLDYENPDWFKRHVPFDDHADGTIFLDPKPVSFSYEPCLVDTDNYANAVLQTTGKSSAQTGQLVLTRRKSLDGQTYVDVNAGSIAACDMRLDVTPQNDEIFRIQDQMGNGQRATFEYETHTLLTDYAEANSCPQDIVSLAGAQAMITTVSRGFMASSPDPEWRALVFAPVTVEISDPLQEHQDLELHLLADATRFHNTPQTLPDSKGHTHKLNPATFENFAQVSCSEQLQIAQVPALN